MLKTFANETTRDIHRGENTKAARRIPQRVWTAAQRRLSALDAATSLTDLRLPGFALEPLKHTMRGFYSIRINDQYRLLFRFEQGDAYDVEVADYHGR
jgi:proteic killer suppression protein